jgi:hypothetical protein
VRQKEPGEASLGTGRRVALDLAPGEGGADVVQAMISVRTSEPREDRGRDGRIAPVAQPKLVLQEPVAVVIARGGCLAGLRESLGGVLADRLEQPIAAPGVRGGSIVHEDQ